MTSANDHEIVDESAHADHVREGRIRDLLGKIRAAAIGWFILTVAVLAIIPRWLTPTTVLVICGLVAVWFACHFCDKPLVALISKYTSFGQEHAT